MNSDATRLPVREDSRRGRSGRYRRLYVSVCPRLDCYLVHKSFLEDNEGIWRDL